MAGPWEPDETEPVPRGGASVRLLIWLAALAAVVAGVWLLIEAFPGAVSSPEDWGWVAWGVFMMALFSSAILGGGAIRWGEKARHAALWGAIVTVLILGVSYRAELAGVAQRVRMTLSPSYPVATGPRELVVTAGEGGHFLVVGKVNGERVRFLVDTGASDTVLSPADARRVGIDTAALRFDRPSETANGVGYGAAFQADSLSVGTITFKDVPIMINQAPMSSSLLGMTFLRRLESFQVKDDRLYLVGRN
ncbi:TIGR02281 family clan AA aspartic protease [Phenylobacterium sp.]|uniref:retropepsin-like aspartic protease family protein n=1 Tax=Phenylobacterium sp. TaxID=1871053 RepID=UPI0027183F0A|nr:TIGR02281 family clan AA aspartic protease [Phenylobacterium sp.]MDO8801494.1 TIGR02281 family clan AA aspartic protease [Phenylobacterium sp.]